MRFCFILFQLITWNCAINWSWKIQLQHRALSMHLNSQFNTIFHSMLWMSWWKLGSPIRTHIHSLSLWRLMLDFLLFFHKRKKKSCKIMWKTHIIVWKKITILHKIELLIQILLFFSNLKLFKRFDSSFLFLLEFINLTFQRLFNFWPNKTWIGFSDTCEWSRNRNAGKRITKIAECVFVSFR